MARSYNMVNVDRKKINHELKKRGLTMTDASLALERCPTFVAQATRRGTMTMNTVILLERLYGIKKEDIELVNEEAQTEKEVEAKHELTADMGELKVVITEAIKEAFVWYANQR